jgi:hypothetical protein
MLLVNIRDFLAMFKYFSLQTGIASFVHSWQLIWHLAISKQLKLKLVACFIPKTDFNFGPLQLLTHGHN